MCEYVFQMSKLKEKSRNKSSTTNQHEAKQQFYFLWRKLSNSCLGHLCDDNLSENGI